MTSLEPDIFSSNAHVLHTTAKQVISRRGKEEKCCEVMVQNLKTLVQNHSWFFLVKYANVSRSFQRRTRGFFSSLSWDFTLNLSLIDRLDFFVLFNCLFQITHRSRMWQQQHRCLSWLLCLSEASLYLEPKMESSSISYLPGNNLHIHRFVNKCIYVLTGLQQCVCFVLTCSFNFPFCWSWPL